MSESSPLVEAQSITVHYGNRMILDHVDLAVHQGEIVTLIGPNGAGKSTLVKVMLGLEKPHHGKVILRDDVRVGYVPQKLHVDPILPLTVRRFLTLTAKADTKRLRRYLGRVGAGSLLEANLCTLSGGELQRIVLARALLRDPQLLILDEPVQGIDVNGQSELYNLIGELRDSQQCGILMVSHDLHLVMAKTDRVFCLDQQVCCTGHPNQLKQQNGFQRIVGDMSGLAPYVHQHTHDSPQRSGFCGKCQKGKQRHG